MFMGIYVQTSSQEHKAAYFAIKRWTNIKTALSQCPVLAGKLYAVVFS